MKKKFLSLMMAAAVVATTSVSAFASTNFINTSDENEAQSEVTITGKVQDENGKDPAGTFKVTVPTTASFTVNKYGNVLAGELEVSNAGTQEIEVYAYQFTDESGEDEINIIDDATLAGALDSKKNSTISLKLTSANGDGTAYLSSNNSDGGVYKNAGLNEKPDDENLGVKILSLSAGSDQSPAKGKILLQGRGGKTAVSTAVTDTFRLTLKIKKADN